MKRSIVISLMALCIASCHKEGSNPVQAVSDQEKVTDYYPLEAGNYWIYEYYTSDSTLVFTDTHTIDSVCIVKDSLYNGNVYNVVFSTMFGISLIRDSAEYLVTNEGLKIFTINQDTSNLVERYLYPVNFKINYYDTWKMKISDSSCSVPSGQYQAKYVLGTVTSTVPAPPSMEKRNYYYAYVKAIGKVYERLGYSLDSGYFEERLVRYHVHGRTF